MGRLHCRRDGHNGEFNKTCVATHTHPGDGQYIMGLTDIFNEAVNFTATVDFSKSQTPDNVKCVQK
jgi:hypothetical protein